MTPEDIAESLCDEAGNWWGRRRSPKRIAEAIRAAVAEEREACAQMVEEASQAPGSVAEQIAAAIRARV